MWVRLPLATPKDQGQGISSQYPAPTAGLFSNLPIIPTQPESRAPLMLGARFTNYGYYGLLGPGLRPTLRGYRFRFQLRSHFLQLDPPLLSQVKEERLRSKLGSS
jgi:hypothetical protein